MLNFFVAFFQFDPVPMFPWPAAMVGVITVDGEELTIGESALSGAVVSSGAPGVGVGKSDEEEELLVNASACREFGRGLE